MDTCDVLIVDDDYAVRDSLSEVLAGLGLSVSEASGGADALAGMSKTRPRVVLLDMGLPDMSGEGVIEAMRASPEFSAIPVVALTGWDGMPPPVLFKPFSIERLVAVLVPYIAEIQQPNRASDGSPVTQRSSDLFAAAVMGGSGAQEA